MNDQKRGPWSWEEKQFIKEKSGKMTPADIAQHLKRSEKNIRKYMQENGLLKYYSSGQLPTEDKLTDITRSVYWKDFVKQFDLDEQESAKYHWSNTIKQFRDDIYHTEEIQIVDMVKIQLLMDRLLNQEADISKRIKLFEEIIHDEKLKPDSAQDKDLIRNYESQIASLYAAIESVSKEYRELLKEKTALFKTLKATRDQRLKLADSGKETMASWYKKMMEDTEFRKNVGIYIEKMRIATEVEYERLTSFHTYADGSIDRPLLRPEDQK